MIRALNGRVLIDPAIAAAHAVADDAPAAVAAAVHPLPSLSSSDHLEPEAGERPDRRRRCGRCDWRLLLRVEALLLVQVCVLHLVQVRCCMQDGGWKVRVRGQLLRLQEERDGGVGLRMQVGQCVQVPRRRVRMRRVRRCVLQQGLNRTHVDAVRGGGDGRQSR